MQRFVGWAWPVVGFRFWCTQQTDFGLSGLAARLPKPGPWMVNVRRVLGVLMLALAYSIGTILNAILHWIVFERVYPGFTRPVASTLFHSFAASVIMGYSAFLSLRIFAGIFPMTKIWGVFMQGLASGLIGIGVLVITLIILQNKEFAEVWRALHHRIWKVPVPPAELGHM